MKYIVAVLFAVYLGASSGADPDYYWRQFNGTVPNDAVDVANKTLLVAQAYTWDGPIPTWYDIDYNGMVYVITYGPEHCYHIKLLCTSDPKSLSWISTTMTTFEADTAGRNLVDGGYQNNLEEPQLFVCRNDGWAGKVYHDGDGYHCVYSPNGIMEDSDIFDVLALSSE